MKTLWNMSWLKYSWAEIRQLLQEYPSLAPDYTSPNSWFDSNLLLLAVKSDDTKFLKKVLEIEKINVNEPCAEGWAALHIASSRGNLEMVKFLVEEKKANIKAKTHDNYTAISLSSGNLEFKVSLYLRELGEEIPRPSGGSSIGRKTSVNFEKKLKDYDKFDKGFQTKNFNEVLSDKSIADERIKKSIENKINMQPKDFKYEVKLFSQHIERLHSLKDFLESKGYFDDQELKVGLIDKLAQYIKVSDLEVLHKPLLTLKALSMFSIINNKKSLDTDFIPGDILTNFKEQYDIDLKLLGKENINIADSL